MLDDFLHELNALCLKHNVAFLGNHRVVVLDEYKKETLAYSVHEVIDCGNGSKDTVGPFLVGDCEKTERVQPQAEFVKCGIQILDREKNYRDGVKSMLNGQGFSTRYAYQEHLKSKNCEIIDANENDSCLINAGNAPSQREYITIPDEVKQMFS